jgi:hypothetical protein
MNEILYGWVCPICKKVMSPYEKTCINNCEAMGKKQYRINNLCADLSSFLEAKYRGIEKLYLDSLNYVSEEKSLTEEDIREIKMLQSKYKELYKKQMGDTEQSVKLSLIAAVDYFKKHRN